MQTYVAKGIILNKKDFREADRLFVVYTEDYGKVEAIAISAKKATSKMAKFLEPMMEVEMMIVRGSTFDRIAELKLLDNFSEIKNSAEKWFLGCYCLELVDKLTKTGLVDKEIYILLKDILNILKIENNKELIVFYVWKLLGCLGYQPSLDKCAECGSEEKSSFFDINKSGLLCSNCQTTNKNGVKTTFEVINLLNQSRQKDLICFENLEIGKSENQQLKQIVSSLLNFHLEYAINSMKFLKS
jgi:DNA repair protein RecO (recombination protein O)